MLKQVLIVVALCGALVGAQMTPEEKRLYMEKGALETVVVSERGDLSPERMLMAVNELQENIYPNLPLPEHPMSQERWVREIVFMLYNIGRPNQENCKELEDFNKVVDAFTSQFNNLKSACQFAKIHQATQNELCAHLQN